MRIASTILILLNIISVVLLGIMLYILYDMSTNISKANTEIEESYNILKEKLDAVESAAENEHQFKKRILDSIEKGVNDLANVYYDKRSLENSNIENITPEALETAFDKYFHYKSNKSQNIKNGSNVSVDDFFKESFKYIDNSDAIFYRKGKKVSSKEIAARMRIKYAVVSRQTKDVNKILQMITYSDSFIHGAAKPYEIEINATRLDLYDWLKKRYLSKNRNTD